MCPSWRRAVSTFLVALFASEASNPSILGCMRMNRNAVLSFSGDPDLLIERELALQTCGLEVVSVSTESAARFEIEMGRCGNLLLCFRSGQAITRELAHLFKKYCPDGCILFVSNQNNDVEHPDVDYIVPDSGGAEAIVRAFSDLGRSRLSKAS
jgi:hypothetical protein